MRGDLTGRTVLSRTALCAILLLGLFGATLLTCLWAGGPVSAQAGLSTWARVYQGEKDVTYGQGIFRMPDGDLVATVTPVRGSYPADLMVQVTRLSPGGDVRWNKTYPTRPVSQSTFVTGIPCSPSGMLIYIERTLMRLDDSGDVVWARNYTIYPPSSAYRSTRFTEAVQLPDGGFAICGVMGPHGTFVCRVDAQGDPLWTRSYAMYGGYGGPHIHLLDGGGFLLGGRVSAEEGWQGVKLMWLTADGQVQRSLGYADTLEERRPWSIQGFAVGDMTVTSEGPVILQPLWETKCRGTTVVQLDHAGGVTWTTWIGSQRRGNIDVHLGGIDVTPDGSLVLVGRTTEFTDREKWGYEAMAARLSAGGDVQWAKVGSAGVFNTADYPMYSYCDAVAATEDGGLAWAVLGAREDSPRFSTWPSSVWAPMARPASWATS